MRAQEYDAVVVGASFAGLAVARQLHGRILLIDRKEIGEGQTSACGAALRTVEKLGVTGAVLASSVRPGHLDHRRLSFGVETVADYGGDRLFFRLDPAVASRGLTRLFPIGGRSRSGTPATGASPG